MRSSKVQQAHRLGCCHVPGAARTGRGRRAGGQAGLAHDALKQLAEITQPCGNEAALGIEARCRALLSQGSDADDLYREAIGRLGHTGLRPALARAHLLYGDWLRREGRRLDAREQLRTAYNLLAAIGMVAFAERARRELAATGETVRQRTVEAVPAMIPQEACIARLAREGRTNLEIGAQLFLSVRTVEWHLRKISSSWASAPAASCAPHWSRPCKVRCRGRWVPGRR
jgi:DNA-binding CsgD family transcriptional regulator